ncbi:alpha-2,8-sialyltransferase 8F-like [Sinocyclocheilus rhinocerous]|uniref:alpha-2,8-sialyltransferase 8F-like n=1 Tax=Sinocyclocheilus rhinocerous TaxID=307959 RepID=UPI0007BA3AF6|nr:PREDICTED: alpha-2,8-sialyltransferase 8F-like [Sinocyclocheilus rhinocerous]
MALVFLRWICRLLTLLVVSHSVCVIFYYTADTHSSRLNMESFTEELDDFLKCPHKPNTTEQELNRMRLQFCCNATGSLFLTKRNTAVNQTILLNMESFTEELDDFLKCPHKPNTTEQELNRMRLQFCCNATGSLFLTKRNTAVNQTIPYETDTKHTYRMNAAIHNMLPECNFVIRFNLALINDSDVGLKTDLITINPSQIQREYKNLEQDPDPLVERVSVYGNASLAMPAFAYTFCTGKSMKTLKVLHPIRPQQPVVFFSPLYLRTLDRFWKGRGLKEIRLSSGFMLINTALELCEHVHVYGFWPFGTDLQDNPVPYHYYDALSPHRYMHKMPEEFVRLLQLHSQGALTLHLQPCSSNTRL